MLEDLSFELSQLRAWLYAELAGEVSPRFAVGGERIGLPVPRDREQASVVLGIVRAAARPPRAARRRARAPGDGRVRAWRRRAAPRPRGVAARTVALRGVHHRQVARPRPPHRAIGRAIRRAARPHAPGWRLPALRGRVPRSVQRRESWLDFEYVTRSLVRSRGDSIEGRSQLRGVCLDDVPRHAARPRPRRCPRCGRPTQPRSRAARGW